MNRRRVEDWIALSIVGVLALAVLGCFIFANLWVFLWGHTSRTIHGHDDLNGWHIFAVVADILIAIGIIIWTCSHLEEAVPRWRKDPATRPWHRRSW